NALGDGDDDLDTCFSCCENSVGRKGRQNKDDRYVGSGLVNSFLHSIEDRTTEMLRTAFSGGYTTDHIGTILNHLSGVEGTFRACISLNKDARIFIDQ